MVLIVLPVWDTHIAVRRLSPALHQCVASRQMALTMVQSRSDTRMNLYGFKNTADAMLGRAIGC